MALIFLVMSCESDGEGDGCLGGTDDLITGMSDGCGTGLTPIGDGCLGSCVFGGDGGCGDCGAGDGCDMGCGDCGDCGSDNPYDYQGDAVEGAIQVHATSSLFDFVSQEVLEIVRTAVGDELEIDNAGYIHYCMEEISEGGSFAGVEICSRKHNCNVQGNPNGPNNGCDVKAKLGNISVTPTGGDRVAINITIDDVRGDLGSKETVAWIPIKCTVKIRQSGNVSAALAVNLPINSTDGNTEIYMGGDSLSLNTDGLDISGCGLGVLGFLGIIDMIVDGLVDGIGALSCRGCDTIADCGGGATECKNGTCRDGVGKCQGIQLGMEMGVDAGSLLQTIDPGAEAAMGLEAYLGSYVSTNDGGLQLGGRLGSEASPQSLCVPVRPSPAQPGVDSCRTGDKCPAIADLNSQGTIPSGPDAGTPYHVGIGVGMSGLNQVLWSAYASGALCLSVGGESEGLEILGTELIGTFVSSLGGLTYYKDQPIMIQLRPQQAPIVEFKPDEGQGAELDVKIPELELDFYTVADQRYARIFTLKVDLELPLGLKVENNELEIALGDLANVIDEETIAVTNVEMVSRSEVQTLVGNLPSIIAGAAGPLLGDDLIPPIEIPEIEGFTLNLVGPGVTILEENAEPAALGVFAELGLASETGGGLRRQLEPVVTELMVDIDKPSDVRAFIAARKRNQESFSYRDIMPNVVAQLDVMGADLSVENIEYAYSINNGPWSFWKTGPALHIDNPMIANEARFDVRITARRKGDPTTGSASHAEFSFVNDRTAPTLQLISSGSDVVVRAKDNVYDAEELTMQYRTNGGEWSKRAPLHRIDLTQNLRDNARITVDVMIEDPSGNARSVRRTFGEKAAVSTPGASMNAGAEEGCSSGGGHSGLLAVFALLGLLMARRRNDEHTRVAASPVRVSLALLAVLLLAFGASGCVDNDTTLRGLTDDCDPACLNNEVCINGVCEAISCSEDDDCPGALECVDGECTGGPQVCEYADDCEYGHICKDGYCTPSECTVSADCDQDMCDGDLLPFCDFDDYSTVEAGECVCESSLALRNYGTWLQAIPLDENDLVALAYNESYGDLQLGVLQDDDTFEWDFVDGVPDGPVEAPPTGARDGIRAAGDDAGRYLSSVAEMTDDGPVLHIAYQYEDKDADEMRLRYARAVRGTAGWSLTTIDIDNLDIAGMFPSIVLFGSDGGLSQAQDQPGIGIVYMTGDAMLAPDGANPAIYFSQVSTAYAATRTPEEASDFNIVEGFDQASVDEPCGNLCASNAVCLAAVNVCAPVQSSCDPECADGEECVEHEGTVQCMAAVAAAQGFNVTSRGLGLFTSSALDDDGVVHTAYYDQIHGVLKYVPLEVAAGALVKKEEPMVVDGELNSESVGDVGRWTNIHQLDDGRIVIFYEDAGRAELRAAVITGANVDITVLDDGVYLSDDRQNVATNRVGSSVFARPLTSGGFEVFYQDTTDMVVRRLVWNDLSAVPSGHPYAIFGTADAFERDPTQAAQDLDASKQVLAPEDGAYGFFVNVHDLPGRTLFSSKRIVPQGSDVVMDVRTGVKAKVGAPVIGPVDPSLPVLIP